MNPLILANREGTLFGNTITRKYLQNVKYVKNATNEAEMKKFRSLIEIFRKYGKTYDMDFLLMMAQGYQESRLDHTAKSHVGAVGVMQIMPATGKELAVGDIKQLEPNINGGVKYMRKLMDTYFKDDQIDPLNKGLMTFASYNAGPGKIRQLRRETAARGLNPNIWFNNVERVVAEKIGRETCTYVSNIYKYYVAYKLTVEELAARDAARQSAGD
jgi:membrane-bound lytic murein transglycosylase MltF